MPKQKKSRSKLLKYLLVFALFLGITSRIVYLKMVQPSGINEITSTWVMNKSDLMIDPTAGHQVAYDAAMVKPGTKLANGCVSQKVQCVKEPCPDIWQCPPNITPPPSSAPVACTRDISVCPNGEKVGRTGPNCEFVCSTPTPKPSPSCIPQPPTPDCAPGKVCTFNLDPKYCQGRPTPTAVPTCNCPPGAMCKMSADCQKPSPSPSPVAVGVASFSATKSCGSSNFMNISFSCTRNKALVVLANESCLDMYSALKKAISYCGTVVTGANAK